MGTQVSTQTLKMGTQSLPNGYPDSPNGYRQDYDPYLDTTSLSVYSY
jgi:hypothetical protein